METHKFLAPMEALIYRLMFVVLVLFCTGCVSLVRIDGPYAGRVVDAETNQPLEGAVALGFWYRLHGTPAGASSEYYDSYEMLTNKNGEFDIPGQGLLLLSNIDWMHLTVFKAGYAQITPNTWRGLKKSKSGRFIWDGDKVTIKMKRLSMEERRERLVISPNIPNSKLKYFSIEENKETIEIGSPLNTLTPLEQ